MINADVVNWPKMPLKLVSSIIGLQTGRQNHAVHRAGNNLLHIRTKDALGDGVPVLFEGLQ